MERVVLVSPYEREYLNNAGDRMPLNLLYLNSALAKNGIESKIFDLNHSSREDLFRHLRRNTPEYVGLSMVTSLSEPQMSNLNREIKGKFPHIKTMVGGFHATARPETLISDFDAVVIGDGERAIVEIVKKNLKGIIKKDIDINEYAVPDRKVLDDKLYHYEIEGLKATGMLTSRGCPYSCTFCGNQRKKVQFRNADNIHRELSQIKEMGYGAVYLYNENFGMSRTNSEIVMDLMQKNDLKFRAEIRANTITKEFAKKLKEKGCVCVAVGVESFDDTVLNAIKKGEPAYQIEQAIEILGRQRIPTKGYFIFGLPYQTVDSCLKTIEKAKQLKRKGLTYADFYAFTPYFGSEIGDNPIVHGVRVLENRNDKFSHAGRKVNSIIETDWLSKDQIEDLIKYAREEFNK